MKPHFVKISDMPFEIDREGSSSSYTYLLLDADGSPFYVGKGSGLRYRAHVRETCDVKFTKRTDKHQKIAETIDQAGRIDIILFECGSDNETVEAALIEEYWDQLTNKTRRRVTDSDRALAERFTKQQVGKVISMKLSDWHTYYKNHTWGETQ